MGSKGQSATTQAQSYTPSPQAASAITGALGQAQGAASLPFSIPQAPVAGFSNQQQQAFDITGNAQGMALPYFNQAQNYFNQSATPDIASYFNPMANAVGAQLQNIFGQQNVQNTANLVQSAGGVGADRIAVGQGNLANQQALAAGQTFAQLYQPAVQAAQNQQNILQGAGYGLGALGPAAQNSVLSGAQALLGTGGLQQQLQQAQLNAPYQLQLAQAQFPYQQSNFLTNAVASLAPGLGGSTYGQGTSTPAQPSILSQIAGLGVAGAGVYGGLTSGGGKGTAAYGGGSAAAGDAYGGNSFNPLPGLTPADYGFGYARGGDVNPWGEHFDIGGETSDTPIDISKGIVPQGQTAKIQPHVPQLNLNQPQQQSDGFGIGDIAKAAANIAPLFLAEGGTVGDRRFDGFDPDAFRRGFDDGGFVDRFNDDLRQIGMDRLQRGFGTTAPDSIPGGEAAPMPVYRDIDNPQSAMAAWRQGVDATRGAGTPQDAPAAPTAYAPQAAMPPSAAAPMPGASPADAEAFPPYPTPSNDPSSAFARNPWLALIAAGAGMMGGTSPFAGVNIGQGLGAGVKTLEAQRAAAQKDTQLEQAARAHEDQYTRMTPYQKFETSKPQPMGQTIGPLGLPMTTFGLYDPASGTWKPVQGNAAQDSDHADSPVKNISDGIISGHQPPTLTGLYRMAPMVRAQLEKSGFNLAQAQLEWEAAHKQVLSLNGPQMVRFVGLANSVDRTIDEVNGLAEQMKNSGIPILNQAKIAALIQTEGNSERGQLAARYVGAVNTLKEEFANLANGGYAPTEPAWKLANEQINGNYGVKELGASLSEVQRLIRYRLQGIPNIQSLGPGAANKYVPGIQAPAGHAPQAPPAQTKSPVVYQNGHEYHLQPDGSYN